MKKVSVIVISYYSKDTILETLESIKKQTYQNIELIITDDGSTDETIKIAEEWINSNKKFISCHLVTTNKNTGIPGNINRALKKATGDYMKLIAADDYLSEDAIEEYVRFCEQHPQKLPISKVNLFTDGGEVEESIIRYCETCYEFTKKEQKEQFKQLLMCNCIVAPAGSFYPLEYIKKIGGYDEAYPLMEDYPMNLKTMNDGWSYGLIDKPLVYYRISTESITGNRIRQVKKLEAKLFFNRKLWYMCKNGMALEALKQSRSWIKYI